jgi:predicted DNA-binding protein
MATLTIRMPEDKANRLKDLAKSRGISVNKLIEEWATMGISEFDAHASFLARAARGSRERGLVALRELNARDSQPESSYQTLHDSSDGGFKHKDED